MKHTYILILFISFLLLGCTPDPWEQLANALTGLEQTLAANIETPENVIPALDKYIADNQELWNANAAIFAKISNSESERKANAHKAQYNAIMQHIIDLDLEIQDQLSTRPDLLNQYIQRIERIGVF